METEQNKNSCGCGQSEAEQPEAEQPKTERPKNERTTPLHLSSFLFGLILGVAIISLLGMGVLAFIVLKPSGGNVAQLQLSGSIQETLDISNVEIPEGVDVPEENRAEILAYLKFKAIKASFIPTGIPDVYGQELNVSFDQVQAAMDKVTAFGPTYGQEGEKIILTGADLERYINITLQTSCQYCCGAVALVKEDGEAACGCAHSVMMRGLAAYLIKNHPELSDERILAELNTWKITFFPKQTLTAKLQELQAAGEPGIQEVLEEFPDFLPQMVGGC